MEPISLIGSPKFCDTIDSRPDGLSAHRHHMVGAQCCPYGS